MVGNDEDSYFDAIEESLFTERKINVEQRKLANERNMANVRRYNLSSRSELQQIKPMWSFESSDLKHNFESNYDGYFPNGYILLEANQDKIIPQLDVDYSVDPAKLFPEKRDQLKIAQVLHEWELGITLTPPILSPLDGKIAVNAGNHRLAVACYLGAKRIPFYIKTEELECFVTIESVVELNRGEWP
jgi:hypothetical protein